MKIAAGVGVVLAMMFALMFLLPLNDLQDTGEAISGLDAPVVSLFQNLPTLGTLLVMALFVFLAVGAIVVLVKR